MSNKDNRIVTLRAEQWLNCSFLWADKRKYMMEMNFFSLQAVRDIQFSHFKKSLLGAVSDDGALNLWDSNTKKLSTSFASDHKGPATGLSFSPMNDMLLCSVGLDKRIVFYDVQQKK